jgi:hypothetical protein
MADITCSPNEDQSEVIFSASTPEGEAFLQGPKLSVPLAGAAAFKKSAEAKGLTVEEFP